MREFKEIFEKYNLNYKTTMERFMGNHEMYITFMDRLFEDENFVKLGDALDRRAVKEAFEAAHTLKGVSANMGLKFIYDVVYDITELLRDGSWNDDCKKIYGEIELQFEKADRLRRELKGEDINE